MVGKKTHLGTKILDMMRGVDYFGGKVELMLHDDTSYKTLLGSFYTAVSFIVISMYLYIVCVKMFDRSSPTVSCNREYDIGKYKYSIIDSDVLPIVVLYNKSDGSVLSPSILSTLGTMRSQLWYSYFDYTLRQSFFKTINLEVKKCAQIVNRKPYNWLFNSHRFDTMYEYFHCVEIPEHIGFLVEGNRVTDNITSLKIDIFPCSLSSSQCQATAGLPNYEQVTLMLINAKKFLRYSDFNQPIQVSHELREELNIQESVGTKIFYFVKSTVLRDETNIFQPKHDQKQFISTETQEVNTFQRNNTQKICTLSEIDANNCSPYLSIEFRSSGIEDTCIRSYTDVLNSFSDIGGFKELVFMGVLILYSFYNLVMKRRFIRSQIMPEKDVINLYNNMLIGTGEKSNPLINKQNSNGQQGPPIDQMAPDKNNLEMENFSKNNNNKQSFLSADGVNYIDDRGKEKNKHNQKHSRVDRIKPVTNKNEMRSLDHQMNKPSEILSWGNDTIKRKSIDRSSINFLRNKSIELENNKGASIENKTSDKDDHRYEKPKIENLAKDQNLDVILNSIKIDICSMIEHNTKVTTIVSELCNLRILKDIIFAPYQQRLLPLVVIENERRRKKKDEFEVGKEDKLKEKSPNKVVYDIGSYISTSLDLKECLELLYSHNRTKSLEMSEKHTSSQHEGPPIKFERSVIDSIRLVIDEYIKDNLPTYIKNNASYNSIDRVHQKTNDKENKGEVERDRDDIEVYDI